MGANSSIGAKADKSKKTVFEKTRFFLFIRFLMNIQKILDKIINRF